MNYGKNDESISRQYDAFIYLNETNALHPLEETPGETLHTPDTYSWGIQVIAKFKEVIMLTFQDEEISKGEKKISEWRSKFVRLQARLHDSSDNISDQFEDMLLKLDEMKIKVEELKNPGNTDFTTISDEIKKIDGEIGAEYEHIQRKLFS